MDYTLIFATVGVSIAIAYSLGLHGGWELHREKLKKLIVKRNSKQVIVKTFSSQSI